MGELFKRASQVTIARPATSGSASTDFFGVGANALVVTDLRVTFQIEKNLGSDPNSATITIYNLTADTRARIEEKPLHVRIDAGYEDQLERLFVGDIRWSSSRREPPDWVTELQIGDGDRAFRYARVSRSYKSGVNQKTILAELSGNMGLKLPTNISEAKDLNDQYSSGVVLTGPTRNQMTKVLAKSGYSWSVQDGKLQALKATDKRTDQAFIVSQDTGMIGTPEFGAPEKKGKSPRLTVRMLLHPGLTPGGTIQMEAEVVKGLFRIERVSHMGDTHGQDWFSEVEAKPL